MLAASYSFQLVGEAEKLDLFLQSDFPAEIIN